MRKKLLIIEDEMSVAKQLKWGLGKEYDITIATDMEQARQSLAAGVFPVATMDLGLPPYPDTPQQGFELLKAIPSLAPHTRVIVITGNAEKENAVRAIALGAADFCAKPIDLKILGIILSRTFKIHELEETNRRLQRQSSQSVQLCGMLGVSPVMEEVFERLKQASMTDYPVLITGNTGTGKEMAAHAVHNLGQRAEKPLVIINCGAIPENLLESELFGYMKGSFSGATADKAGLFEVAHKGTIFLDEIGELPPFLQVKLLRVVQEKTFRRIGGAEDVKVDVRIISATNQELEQRVKDGHFREDLYYRLNVIPVKIPPLRERNEDIPLLTRYFIEKYSKEFGKEIKKISPYALMLLMKYPFPGNVRELENIIERSVALETTNIILPENLVMPGDGGPDQDTALSAGIPEEGINLNEELAKIERLLIKKALQKTNGSKTKAAKLLNVSFDSLRYRLEKLDI